MSSQEVGDEDDDRRDDLREVAAFNPSRLFTDSRIGLERIRLPATR